MTPSAETYAFGCDGTCTPVREVGEPCGDDDFYRCQYGLVCSGETCVAAGTIAIGEPCDEVSRYPRRNPCVDGASCSRSDAGDVCRAWVRDGETCTRADTCVDGEPCVGLDYGIEGDTGTCGAYADLGDPCTIDLVEDICPRNLRCDANTLRCAEPVIPTEPICE